MYAAVLSLRSHTHRPALRAGARDVLPIALGYLAVSFTLGIAARNAGLNPLQGFFASLLCNASAGEYAGFTAIAARASLWELAAITLVANARYLLMGCAISQKFAPGTAKAHRLLVGYDLTDEIFGITLARPGALDPYYTYGAVLAAAPCWAIGTALGVSAGNLLPARAVSALSVALYGMFLAVIVPPAKKEKPVRLVVAAGFVLSFLASRLPVVSSLSAGTRTILLTLLLSAGAALAFPRGETAAEVQRNAA